MTRHRPRLTDDAGSTLPLIICFCALTLAFLIVVIAITALYIERKRLYSLADAAALVGAESFSVDDVHATTGGFRPTLTSGEVSSSVARFVADNPSDEFIDLRVARATTTDGRSATVELSAYWSPPVVSAIVPRGFRIEVTSVARSVFS